jgi:hypothetical protein
MFAVIFSEQNVDGTDSDQILVSGPYDTEEEIDALLIKQGYRAWKHFKEFGYSDGMYMQAKIVPIEKATFEENKSRPIIPQH